MRKIQKERLRGIIGILCMVIAVGAAFYWEGTGRQAFTYEDVIVLKEPVAQGMEIKRSMLGIIKMEKNLLIDGVVRNPENIIGKEAAAYLPAGLQLTEKFFEEKDMSSGNGKYIFKIPEEWLYSYPQTLRRGDDISIYAIAPEEAGSMDGMTMASHLEEPVLKTKVAYARDGTNREVVNVGSGRFDGSASIAQIEILVSEEEYNSLCRIHDEGFMLNLLYE